MHQKSSVPNTPQIVWRYQSYSSTCARPCCLKTLIRGAILIIALTLGGMTPGQRAHGLEEAAGSLQSEFNIEYGKTPEQVLRLDVYRPKSEAILPACILIHGGGWIGGDKERFRALGMALARKGYVVANVEYRLAGAARYPAAVQDCSLAVRWVRANANRFSLDPNRIGAWGGSAGGHLVGLLAAAPSHERFLTPESGEVSASVQASCIMAGPTDLTNPTFVEAVRRTGVKSNSYQWFGKLFDEAPELYREASPITHFTQTTGPVLFITGERDNPERDMAAISRLKSLSVATEQIILKDAKHGCWMQQPWFEQCVEAADAWFRKHLQ